MSRRSRGLAVVAVLLLVALSLLIWSTVTVRTAGEKTDDALAAARRSASQVAIDVTSYDYRKLPSQFSAVAAETTGKALTSFRSSRNSIQSYFTSQKMVTVGTAYAVAVVPGASANAVTVLVALTVTQSANGAAASQSAVQISCGMVKQGGRWVAETVSGPGQ